MHPHQTKAKTTVLFPGLLDALVRYLTSDGSTKQEFCRQLDDISKFTNAFDALQVDRAKIANIIWISRSDLSTGVA